MSYEIPQSLQYQEKIIFNLTLEQLIYAALFGFPAILMYAKLPFSIYTRVTLAFVPVSLGLMFMYLDLWHKIRDFWAYLKFRRATMFDKAMKKYLKLNAVENSCYEVQTKNGTKRVAVLRVEPLNFKIKTKDERDSIIFAFQKFLNALDFPVQFLMYTDELNLNDYLKQLDLKVDKTGNKTYKELLDAHKKYVDLIMREKSDANRRFLISIIENEMGLDAQVKIVEELLATMNLKCVRLGGRQLIGVLIRLFNNPRGRTEILKKEKTIYTITAPEEIVNKPDYIKVNEYYNRIIVAVGYPRVVEEGFLDKMVTAAGNFDLSIHIEPFPIENTLVMLNKEVQKQRADLFAAELKHSFQPSLEIQYRDTQAVLNSIQKGEEKLFNVSLYINVKAKDLKELDILTKTIQSRLNSMLIIPKVPKYRMAQAFRSIIPFGINELGIRRNITTHPLSAFFPFTSPFLMLEKGGVFLGINKNRLPIIKDIFNLSNANGAILATSGGGKSYTAKLIISRYLINGTKIIVIDPQDEYTKLTEKYGGSVINISRDSNTIINPLDLLNHTYPEKRLALLDFFTMIFGDFNELQKAIVDKAISQTYANAGITEKNYFNKIPPTLKDLYEELEQMNQKATGFEKAAYTTLLSRLSMYVTGVFAFLNQQTKINITNQFVTFNLGSMPKQIKPIMMFLILEYVYTKMKQDKERKLLVIDEAWSLLSRAEDEGYIFEIVKTCRKFNLGLLLITQDVADLVNSKAGRAVLANSSYTILLRQKPAVIDSVESVFHLSFAEREHLLSANVGEGLLLMENDHQEIKVVASKQEHALITTKPDELLFPETDHTADLSLDGKKLVKELYPLKDVYRLSGLHLVQKEFLDNLRDPKYSEELLIHPYEGRQARFKIRYRGNEGADHISLSWWIYEELLNLTPTAIRIYSKTNEVNPDITFTNASGKVIAIEVETGSNYRFNKAYLLTKIATLERLYPHRWCLFLSTNAYYRQYRAIVPPHIRIYLRKHLRWFLKEHFPSGRYPPLNTTTVGHDKNIDETSKPSYPTPNPSYPNQKQAMQGVQA